MCDWNPNLDGIWVVAGDWYGIFVLLMYYLLTGLPQNTSLTVLWINVAIGLEGGVNEGMLLVGVLSIVCRGVQVAFEPFSYCFMLMPPTELVLCLRPNSTTGTNFRHIFVSVDKAWDYAIFAVQGGRPHLLSLGMFSILY